MERIALFGKGEGDGDAAIGVVSSPCRGAIEALILAEEEEAMQEGATDTDETAAAAVAPLAGATAFASPGAGCMVEVVDKADNDKRTHLAPPAVCSEGHCGEVDRLSIPAAQFVDVSLSSLDASLALLARGARAHPIERRLGELQRLIFRFT